MKSLIKSVLLLALIAVATQDIAGRKGCDCSICKGVDNKINPVVGKRIGDDGGGKSGCNICERRKEMLRMEREKQRQLQKCPFEILGSPPVKGKTSEEIFDEFRELIIPSQNGFFDMMRGVVRTMHVSSEAELKWAKEKEARELAKKKLEEAEEAKKQAASKLLKRPRDEIVGLNSPVNPKVTVVLKQTPCGQIIQPSEPSDPEKVSLLKRLPKEVDGEMLEIPEEEVLQLQPIELNSAHDTDLISEKNLLHSDLIDHLVNYKTFTTMSPQNEEVQTAVESQDNFSTFGEQSNLAESSTESPFVKFVSNDEMKALSFGKNSLDDFDMGWNMLPNTFGADFEGVDKENAQDIDYSLLSLSV